MADTNSTGTLRRTDRTPTAPLPATAAEALARLERAFIPVPLDVVRAVARYEAAALRYDELIARPASELSPAEVDAIGDAQQTMANAFGLLAEAGRTDLLTPLNTATRYQTAAARYRRLAANGDYDGCADAHDEMAMCLCRLEKAGRLDLIGGQR